MRAPVSCARCSPLRTREVRWEPTASAEKVKADRSQGQATSRWLMSHLPRQEGLGVARPSQGCQISCKYGMVETYAKNILYL